MRRRSFVATSAAAAALSGGAWHPHAAAQANAAVAPGAELVFGQSAPLSGALGEQVRLVNLGAQIVFDEINAIGGVQGHKIRLKAVDDQSDPSQARAAYQALLTEQRVFGLFGCVGSASSAAAEAVLRSSGAVAFGGYGVTDSVREASRGAAYFVRAGYGRECEALVAQLVTIGISGIAVVHVANPGGEEVLQLIKSAMAARHLEVAVSAAVTQEGSNINEAAKKLLALQPQAVLMFLAGPPAAELMETVHRLGGRPGFYGLSLVAGEQVMERLGERARGLALSEVMPYPWHAADPDLIKYRRLAAAAKLPVGYATLEGYVNARVLVEALQRCGGEFSRQRLHAVLRKMQWRYAGLDLDFGAGQGTGSTFVDLVQIAPGGRYIR
jgi:ABC-type branched-subunit amino acid transport system substrate-binding protein